MKPNEGRLQIAEHILLRVLRNRLNVTPGIAKFSDFGLLEVISKTDLRGLNQKGIEDEVNRIIKQNLDVRRYNLSREKAIGIDLSKVPSSVKEITVVDIEGFDTCPCRDPHVSKTSDIGRFKILKIERVGKDRYRFSFKVE